MKRLDVVEQVLTCTACELHAQCNGPVALRGDHARIAIVGEAPGETEDRDGRPFIGPAGKLLAELLAEVDIDIEGDVSILNSVSCWPHRTPTWEHIVACRPNVAAQLDYIEPEYVLLLGRVAFAGMRPDIPLKHGRGRPFRHNGRLSFCTYHPAAALRNPTYEDCMRADLQIFRQVLDAGDAWDTFVPDTCAGCPNPVEWYEQPAGLGWCPIHLPSSEQPAYEARTALLAAELDAVRRRAAGMAAVEDHTDTDWMSQAWDQLIGWLRTHDEFFVDDWWAGTGMPEPRESRALGPIVMRAAREGLMEKSGEFRKSVRSNMTEKPVWRSLLR